MNYCSLISYVSQNYKTLWSAFQDSCQSGLLSIKGVGKTLLLPADKDIKEIVAGFYSAKKQMESVKLMGAMAIFDLANTAEDFKTRGPMSNGNRHSVEYVSGSGDKAVIKVGDSQLELKKEAVLTDRRLFAVWRITKGKLTGEGKPHVRQEPKTKKGGANNTCEARKLFEKATMIFLSGLEYDSEGRITKVGLNPFAEQVLSYLLHCYRTNPQKAAECAARAGPDPTIAAFVLVYCLSDSEIQEWQAHVGCVYVSEKSNIHEEYYDKLDKYLAPLHSDQTAEGYVKSVLSTRASVARQPLGSLVGFLQEESKKDPRKFAELELILFGSTQMLHRELADVCGDQWVRTTAITTVLNKLYCMATANRDDASLLFVSPQVSSFLTPYTVSVFVSLARCVYGGLMLTSAHRDVLRKLNVKTNIDKPLTDQGKIDVSPVAFEIWAHDKNTADSEMLAGASATTDVRAVRAAMSI
jgi:hypothetical protein